MINPVIWFMIYTNAQDDMLKQVYTGKIIMCTLDCLSDLYNVTVIP